ncbi:hypothetical protein BHAP_0562 [Bifidobacterium hapali]|uniref:Uncharacterized protein n=1 Tax=Bifidobacterium hapali TaxID=1630172 RepID=A0A261G2F1_9BIFI|nr:hypothetical protein [Bifidobacterium hapali]OZG65614.1 hypothetical protein BHAP_0562 [Bifidobacterium hapali]
MTNNGPDQKKNQLGQDAEQVAEQTTSKATEQADEQVAEHAAGQQAAKQATEQAAEWKGIWCGLGVGAVLVTLFWLLDHKWEGVFWTSEAITGLFAVEATAANAVKAIWWATVNDRENKKPTKSALDAFVPSMSAVSGAAVLSFPFGLWSLGLVAIIAVVLIAAFIVHIRQSKIHKSAILSKSATPDAQAANLNESSTQSRDSSQDNGGSSVSDSTTKATSDTSHVGESSNEPHQS